MSDMDKRLSDIESQRLELEDNIAKLRKSLQHWQTWDAEYEALKEEVDETADFDGDQLSRIQHDFGGELLTAKEIDEIFGRQKLRSKTQIIDVLDRRIDYVTDNIRTLRKQLDTAEEKLADTSDDLGSETDGQGDELTEIVEELDDDDNVLSYQLKTPGQALPHVKEALKKAGVNDLPGQTPQPGPKPTASVSSEPRVLDVSDDPKLEEAVNANAAQQRASEKKNVAFTEDTKVGDEAPQPTSRNARRVEQIMQTAKEQEELMDQNPVIPEDEDPEDAAMRQAMLNYSMREVGAIVAEMELEEINSDEDYEFEYSDLEEEEEEDDDVYGRYKGRVVTADYQERMLELEKKLGVRSRFTEAAEQRAAEDSDSDDGAGPAGEGIGRIKISGAPAAPSATKAAPVKSSLKTRDDGAVEQPKGVRFAQALDIATEEEPASLSVPAPKETKDIVEPMRDTIVERTAPSKPVETTTTRKPSRFKQNKAQGTAVPQGPFDVPSSVIERNAQDLPAAPNGPSGTTIADTLVERETNARAVPPDEIDDSMIQDEVADEYQRMRQRFIQREGGFLKEDESQVQPLEEAHGGPQRMSRFKAARLSRQ